MVGTIKKEKIQSTNLSGYTGWVLKKVETILKEAATKKEGFSISEYQWLENIVIQTAGKFDWEVELLEPDKIKVDQNQKYTIPGFDRNNSKQFFSYKKYLTECGGRRRHRRTNPTNPPVEKEKNNSDSGSETVAQYANSEDQNKSGGTHSDDNGDNVRDRMLNNESDEREIKVNLEEKDRPNIEEENPVQLDQDKYENQSFTQKYLTMSTLLRSGGLIGVIALTTCLYKIYQEYKQEKETAVDAPPLAPNKRAQ